MQRLKRVLVAVALIVQAISGAHVLALGGHMHAGERIVYDADGLETRFNQTPAIVGPSAGAGMRFVSGFTVYTVRNGVIDEGDSWLSAWTKTGSSQRDKMWIIP